MPFAEIVRPVVLAAMMGAGLWPHFSTPASWLAAAVLAGTLYVLGKDTLRTQPLWWIVSVGIAVGLWLIRAGTSLVVRPEQLQPLVEKTGVSPTLFVLCVLASVATVWGLHRFRRIAPKHRIGALLALAIAAQILSSVHVGRTVRQLSREEPGDYSYNFDGIRYLKAFYLMKHGADWYEACIESTRVDARGPFPVPRVVMNYRPPTLYTLLSFLPDGGWIQITFIILSCCALWAVMDIVRHFLGDDERTLLARREPRPRGVAQQAARVDQENSEQRGLCALSAAVLCSPYLLVGAVTWFYTFHEYWAYFAAVCAFSLLARRQTVLAILLGVLSVCIREHFLLALIVISVVAFRSGGTRARLSLGAGWILLILVYVVHVTRALPYTGQGVGAGAAVWLHWPSLKSVLFATLFGSTLYPWPIVTVPVVFLSALWGLWCHKNQPLTAALLGLVCIPVLAYLMVGPQVPSGGYWGVVYMPWVFLAAPLALAIPKGRPDQPVE